MTWRAKPLAGDYERDAQSGLLLPRHARRGIERVRPQFMCGPAFFGASGVTFKIAMDFEGSDGGSVFTDTGSLGLTWTRSGVNVTTSIAVVLAGSTSLRVNNPADYLETSGFLLPATQDWELTFRVRLVESAGRRILSVNDTSGSAAGSQFQLYMSTANGGGSASNKVFLYLSDGTNFNVIAQTVNVVAQNVDQNWKMSRVGNTITLDCAGDVGTGTFSGSINQPSGRKFRIGKPEITGESGPNVLYLDTLRFV